MSSTKQPAEATPTEVLLLSFKDRKDFTDILLRAVEQNPSAVAITDAEGVLEYVNAQFCAVTGYAPEEIIGRSSSLLKSGAMPKAFYEDLWRTLEAGEDWRGEFYNRKKNGELYWEAALISPVRDEQGAIQHYLKLAEDITVQKRLQADLEERDERLRLITNHMADMVSFLDPKGRYQYTTPSCRTLLGYAPEDLIGTDSFALMHPDHLASTREAMRRLFKEGTGAAEFQYRHKDGHYVWMEAVGNPIPGPGGRPIGAVVVARGIEERKRNQQDLQASYDRLATTIQALKASEQRLQRMAHLDALTGLLNRRGFEEELHRVWALADRQQGWVGLLIADLDHFKAINDFHGHPTGDQVLRECTELLKQKLRGSDVLCRYGGDEMVAALPLTNPEETRAAGERILEAVRGHRFCAGLQGLNVTLSLGASCGRAGPGATPDALLTQADQALYKAKQTGRNRLCFWEPSRPAAEPAELPGAAQPGRSARGRVIVVDDDPDIVSLVARIVTKAGYEAETFARGDATREYMGRQRGLVDVALVDLNLVGENGLELIQTLRRDDDTLVCIVITGLATMENAIEAMRGGAFDFVTKPFQTGALEASLDRATHYRRLLLENRRYQNQLEDLVRDKSMALTRTVEQLRASYRFTLEALAAMLDAREKNTGDHSKRVAGVARALAQEMKMSEDMVEVIAEGALLHDLGKIAIPDAILLKRGPLTEDEWRIVRTHPEIGHNILRANPDLDKVAEIVWSHQERYDGTGYPRGLKGEAICIGARIFAVVDAYDAIRSDRPYAKSQSPGEALREIQGHCGAQFDPRVVEALTHCQARIESFGWWSAGRGNAPLNHVV